MMCVVCGCGGSDGVGGEAQRSAAVVQPQDLHYGAGPAGVSIPGLSQTRTITLEADVLGANQQLADRNRAHFQAHGVRALNLLSSPGSGKTTLLCATILALRERAPHVPLAVIEGDQHTRLDAERVRAAGAPAIQVNTGRGCHLDAQMVGDAFARLDLHDHAHGHHHGHGHRHPHDHGHDPSHDGGHPPALLFIENVGNLVCPALWDLGEAAKVVILSVTEGADKPLKYPDMFAAASLLLVNKTDLLAHVDFDVAQCIAFARRVNPGLQVLELSATRGTGMDAWLDWLLHAPPRPVPVPSAAGAEDAAALRARIAALEAQLAALQGQP
jgi:hydrogenase nickel incorporation protein HypB